MNIYFQESGLYLLACMLSCFSCVWRFVTLWTVACQATLSMGFSRQKSWRGLPFPPPGDLPGPVIEHPSPVSFTLQTDSLLVSHLTSSLVCLQGKWDIRLLSRGTFCSTFLNSFRLHSDKELGKILSILFGMGYVPWICTILLTWRHFSLQQP